MRHIIHIIDMETPLESEDYLEILVGQAHQVISETSLLEFIDLDPQDARARINDRYTDLSIDEVDRYLSVLSLLRLLTS